MVDPKLKNELKAEIPSEENIDYQLFPVLILLLTIPERFWLSPGEVSEAYGRDTLCWRPGYK